jgi:hypothetical protein
MSLWLYSPSLDLGHIFSFLIFKRSVGLRGRGDEPVAHTEQHKQNKCKQTSMPRVGFEPMIPAFEWAKTVHASGRGATVIGGVDV